MNIDKRLKALLRDLKRMKERNKQLSKIVQEITVGSKKLLSKTLKREAALAKKAKKKAGK